MPTKTRRAENKYRAARDDEEDWDNLDDQQVERMLHDDDEDESEPEHESEEEIQKEEKRKPHAPKK
jgi:hypothetical protein